MQLITFTWDMQLACTKRMKSSYAYHTTENYATDEGRAKLVLVTLYHGNLSSATSLINNTCEGETMELWLAASLTHSCLDLPLQSIVLVLMENGFRKKRID